MHPVFSLRRKQSGSGRPAIQTLLLFGTGLAGVAARARRRKAHA